MTYADTGQPVPRALVSLGPNWSEADKDGRFRVNAGPGNTRTNRFGIRAQSPDGASYLLANKQGEWPKGAIEQSVDLAIPRGVVVRGKITEEGTGRPVAGAIASVTSYPVRPPVCSAAGFQLARSDGCRRQLPRTGNARPRLPRRQGPDDDYVLHELGVDGGDTFRPGRRRFYARLSRC